MLKKFIIILFASILMLGISGNVLATDATPTATSTINGVTVNWSYKLNEANQIEELKCTNISVLIGNITVPSAIDGKTVISIGSFAFKDAINITEVTIPNSVEKIGISAFENCTNLTKVNLPEGLKEFGWNVFEGCTGLTEFTIPKNVESAQSIFIGCTNLTKVTFEEGIKEIPAYVCDGVTGITEITIPNSVERIGINAFENCTNLKKIIIPDNVKNMGWGIAQSNDTVFINHNNDLTIYCYEDSLAAEYAIKYNIKYVYLTKPVDTKPVEDDKKSEVETPNDTTIATGELPRTGVSIIIVFVIFSTIVIAVVFYKKYYSYKDIK